MDPVIDNDWLTCKNDLIDETPNVGNIARSWQWRERGINPPNYPSNKTVLENIAEDILVQKTLKIRCCDLPGYPRSTFLMVFSPDGTKVASTHGNHNVYVSELASGKHVRILKGHPRTPWCIAFHPSHAQLIGSGCLGGQVRVWDISSGGSEVWNVHKETVIASIAFHPREQLLVIATYNELYFWDWSQPVPFTRVSTNNVNEKVRYVAFDALGDKLITGISLWGSSGAASSLLQQNPMGPMNTMSNRRDDPDDSPGGNRTQENSGTAQDMIVNSYQNLVQRYDSLVRNYQRLFMVRHRLTNTPPPPSTIDRGTDPMETDVSPGSSGWTPNTRSSVSSGPPDDAAPGPSTSRRQDSGDIVDNEGSSSRLLNLDVLSFDSTPSRSEDSSNQDHSVFGSRSSAFQPLTEGRLFRTVDQNERSTRLLPNPFSASTSRTQQSPDDAARSSRTSIFTSSRSEFSWRAFMERRRNSSPSNHTQSSTLTLNTSASTDDTTLRPASRGSNVDPSTPSPQQNMPSTSGTNTHRPTMTNSSTQMSPVTGPVDAQTINESLDLIRDILRDSGTRLLNLITNMSLSTVASVERSIPRRGSGPRAQSDDSENSARSTRPRARPLSPRSNLRRDFLSSSSDSDSDQSLEVNIFRTRNASFQDDDSIDTDRTTASTASERSTHATDRMVFDLNDEPRRRVISQDTGAINVSLSNDRFRVRTQNQQGEQEREETRSDAQTEETDQNSSNPPRNERPVDYSPRPSTSRDDFWSRGDNMPSEEAFRKVRGGVTLLHKHTVHLMNLWVRGNRTTLRDLRNMWENLRRRILSLHRETRQDMPSYYTRSLLERCMMLTDMADNARSALRTSRNNLRNEGTDRNADRSNGDTSARSESTNNSNATDADANATPTDSVRDRRSPFSRSPQRRSTNSIRSSPSLRRRLQCSYRWRPEDELRRRTRNPSSNRLAPRFTIRSRRDFARAIEISATRHEIRMRAMQVLSIMFNMMMMCLEERGLSQLIINMLRTLKKALALTCLMLMMNRNNSRQQVNTAPAAQRMESLNVVRIQNVDHTGPVNVDGPEDLSSPNPQQSRNSETEPKNNENKATAIETPSLPLETDTQMQDKSPSPTSSPSTSSQKWSNRLAVQIAAANRNTSATAINRRDLYLESRRLKALHRTNPAAHPIIKKKALPPVSTHRIPAVRYLPGQRSTDRLSTPRIEPRNDTEPVAGPSTERNTADTDNQAPRDQLLNEFDHRVNLVRLAHLQAMRLRNAARTRFRRLQTIRLYTPSSVREMFALQSNNGDNQPGNRSPLQNGAESGNRRSFATYRPHILTPRSEAGNRSPEEPGHFHTVLNNVAMPLMQVNELPANAEAQNSQPQRLPRIHEYLQPIILAQNAMVVDEEGNEGMGGAGGGGGGARRISAGRAGLLDASIISDTLPAPSHRVQAWDFTTGHTPDIADSTKNVVVQRCRIHNDASIDISKDGRLLVALLPVPRLRNSNHWLGVYSLEWGRLGQCLHTAALEQSAVSVALSPTARHLAVGLGSRRFTTTPHARNNVFALLYRLEPLESSSRTGLSPIKELEQNWEQGFTSLNCLRWAPQPGQGLVYANNTGQLIIMS